MRICALIKYPPIQGGVSSRSFWFARGLAELGHEVYVVTHADLVEDSYRIELLEDDLPWLEYDPEGPGKVELIQPQRDSRRYVHIPQGPMHTERLAALATQVVREHDCDIIVSYYFQPFSIAAHLASQWTGVPYTVQHAGSDLGRLMTQPDVHVAYREVITRADGVLTSAPRCFMAMGVDLGHIYRPPAFALPQEHFHAEAKRLDFRAHISAVAQRHDDIGPPASEFDPELPTIGIYGKLGEPKGSFDLLEALAVLHKEGQKFNFIAMTRGRDQLRYRKEIKRHRLDGCTWVLPFIPHHKVPGFLRACNVLTFLERDFPITFHTPTIPTEILSCAGCLVVSREIADKQRYRGQFRQGENVVIVEDPKDHGELASALRPLLADTALAASIAREGGQIEDLAAELEVYAGGYAAILEDILAQRGGAAPRLSASERGVPEDRVAALKDFAHPLWLTAASAMDAVLADYLREEPETKGTVYEDAAQLCAYIEAHPLHDAPPGWSDTLRLTNNILWLGLLSDQERHAGPFAQRNDRTLLDGVWLDAAPLRSSWLRIECFEDLPSEIPWSSPNGPVLLAFHKLANLRGNVFGVNEATRALLQRCDGRTSCRRLAESLAETEGLTLEQVVRTLSKSLRWWYARGLITFVEVED